MPIECINHEGRPVTIQTPAIDELVEIVSGKKRSDRKQFAVEILQYVAQKRAENEKASDFVIHAAAYHMIVESDVSFLWLNLRRLVTVRGDDGIERLGIENVKQTSQLDEITVPAPVQGFAVPLPVVPPSDVELKAIEQVHSQFTPEKVKQRIAAVKNAEQSKPSSTVQQIEAEMASYSDLMVRYEGIQKELAQLRKIGDDSLSH
jgi:hypothetical protein